MLDDVRDAAFMLAAGCGPTEIVAHLIGLGAPIDNRDGDGNTTLMRAVWRERAEMVSYLIDAGVPLDAQDRHGNTALYLAAQKDSPILVRLLLAAGADATQANAYGASPEDVAQGEVLQILVAHREMQVLRQAAGAEQDQAESPKARRKM